MATEKTSRTSRKPGTGKAAGKKNIRKNTQREEPSEKDKAIRSEAYIIAFLALSILLIISVFTGVAGTLGAVINRLFFSLFGIGAFILPFALMLGCLFAGFKKFRATSFLKNSLMCLFFIAFISVVHVFSLGKISQSFLGLKEYLAYFLINGNAGNGGLVGSVFGGVLVKLLGKIGAYVILFSAMLICGVIITERSVFEVLSAAAAKTANTAKKIGNRNKNIFSRASKDERAEAFNRIKETGKNKPLKIDIKQPDSLDDVKKRINKKSINYDYKLDWDGDFEKLPFAEQVKLVEEAPEQFGFAVEEDAALETTGLEKEQIEETEDIVIERLNEPVETIKIFEDGVCQQVPVEAEEQPPFETTENIENNERTNIEETKDDEKEIEVITYSNETAADEKVSNHFDKHEQLQASSLPDAAEESKTARSAANEFIDYVFPPIDLLRIGESFIGKDTKVQMLKNAQKLEDTLKSFGVAAKVIQINKGPTVTRYELAPNQGVKVSKIVGLADDIALNLASNGIRIEAPVPGKSVVGIEVPNKEQTPVFLREVLESEEFKGFESKVAFGVGKDIGGQAIVADISKMPHLLIAGATGAGKSVCINTLITSILYKASPNEVKLILIDPKVVELSIYNGIPHLLIPVVTDPKKAAGALNWAVHEMIKRYKLFSEESVRDLKGYNSSMVENFEFDSILPNIVIIIDELSDLMMAAPKEVEDAIMRLAQMARAAGIHLIIATQRPSVDVITGVIKANIPSRLAFAVSSGTDSRTILDMVGAEKLLGKGDMLFSPIGMSKPVRVQGAFISDKEVENIVSFIKEHRTTEYDQQMVEEITTAGKVSQGGAVEDSDEEYFDEAVEFLLSKEKASVSMLQRQFRIGYNRAARLMETLEANGIVGPEDGSRPRKVIMTRAEYNSVKE